MANSGNTCNRGDDRLVGLYDRIVDDAYGYCQQLLFAGKTTVAEALKSSTAVAVPPPKFQRHVVTGSELGLVITNVKSLELTDSLIVATGAKR